MGSINFDSIYQNLCNILKAEGRVEKISKSFSTLSNDEARVNVALELLNDVSLLPSKRKVRVHSKNAQEAINLRNDGNKMFMKKDDLQALQLYTRSIAYAPVTSLNDSSSDTLSLGFANRSAVLFSLKKYEECLRDINLAFQCGYPSKLKYKLLERKGRCFTCIGSYQEAHNSFMEALENMQFADGLSEDKKKEIWVELQNLERQIAPEQLQSTSEKQSNKFSEISFERHSQIFSASKILNVSYSEELGRYVEAMEDVKPGDVLLVEKPYASVLLPDRYYSHCFHCLKYCWALLPCQHCSTVLYCSDDCRVSNWKQSHRVECTLLPAMLELDAGKFSLLALRLVLVASKCGDELPEFLELLGSLALEEVSGNKLSLGFEADGTYRSDSYRSIYHLVGNTEKRSVADMFRRAVTAACILDCLQNMSNFFQGHGGITVIGGVLLRHLQNLPCNAHEVSEYVRAVSDTGHAVAESIEVGAAAYAVLSLLNHSCDPNAVRHSIEGDSVVLRALRPIYSGQQVLDNYGMHYALHSRETRQNHLSSQYHFTCCCEPCLQDWPCYGNLPSTTPRYLCKNCGHQLPNDENVTTLVCTLCNIPTNVLLLQQQLLISSKIFLQLLTQLLSGNELENTEPLVAHLQLLDLNVGRPWKEYSDCQETLKQCFNFLGNYYKR